NTASDPTATPRSEQSNARQSCHGRGLSAASATKLCSLAVQALAYAGEGAHAAAVAAAGIASWTGARAMSATSTTSILQSLAVVTSAALKFAGAGKSNACH